MIDMLMLFADSDPAPVVTERIETLGPFGWTGGIVAGAALILASTFWLIHQRRLLGIKTVCGLSLLRAVVIAVAVLMVAQPTWNRTETSTRTAELLVLADASDSMNTIDPEQSTSVNDWTYALSDPDSSDADVQRAEVDLKMASRGDQINVELLQRAQKTLVDVADRNEPGIDLDLLGMCRQSIASAVLASQRLESETSAAKRSALMTSRLDDVESAAIAVAGLRLGLQAKNNTAAGVNYKSRKDYIAELMTQFEDRLQKGDLNNVRIRKATFRDQVVPITPSPQAKDSWTKSLKGSSDTNASATNPPAATNLSAALAYARSLASSSRLSGVLLLSEGQHNSKSTQSPVEVASSMAGTPVFTVSIGASSRRRDVLIHQVKAPGVIYESDRPLVKAMISGYECAGDSVEVTLSQNEKTIATRTVRFPSEISDVEVEFSVPPVPVGFQNYEINVEAVDEELTTQNNLAVFSIQTIKDKLEILLADNGPRFEQRFLESLFRRDERIALDKVLLQPTIKSTLSHVVDHNSLLPTTVDEWSKYDVVILGDLPPDVFTEEARDSMASWVRSGGKLVVIAGDESMPHRYVTEPWFDLLPVTNDPEGVLDSFRPRPTPEGLFHPAIALEKDARTNAELWRRWMSGPIPGRFSPYHSAKPSAVVLASLEDEAGMSQSLRSSGRPAWFCLHRVGSGEVAYLSSPISYRLRIRSADKYHHRFWGQLIRRMTTTSLSDGHGVAEIRADRSSYDQGQRPGFRVRLIDTTGLPVRNGEVQVELSVYNGDDPSMEHASMGEPTLIPLVENPRTAGLYEATIDPLPEAVYQIRAVGPTVDVLRAEFATATASLPDGQAKKGVAPTATFGVESLGDLETLITSADPVLMNQISEASGGVSIPPAAIDEVLHLVSTDPEVSRTRQSTPLWDRWSYLWIILGCLTTEWWVRRTRGLI